ncbi:MAG: PQQ-binding-like beta-propeller repeat protein [Akkermansiaceae bacterium]|jgi:outer membrane protein assembly factor BamB|nr:PQQ-binding-like beta-propeller repeat protein [Akkermansiaceae bacterium]
MKAILGITAGVLVAAGAVCGENWANWRGPAGNGSTAKSPAPTEFSEKSGILWKAELPGRGCSTPVTWGERIFVTTPIGKEDGVMAFDWKGEELWRKTLGALTPGRGQRVGSSANSSPITDGKHVFAYFKSGNVAGFTVEGTLLWKVNLHEKYGEDKLWWDQGTSPVLAGGNIVIAVMQTEGNSYLVSLDPKTGDEVWFTKRDIETTAESGDSYATPHVVEINGVETIVSFGADHLTGHDAKSGKELWRSAGFNPDMEKMWRVIASSVVTNDVVVVPFKRGDALGALKLDGIPAKSDKDWLWRKDGIGTDAVSPVALNGKLIIVKDSGKTRGLVTCLDALTGKVVWEANLPKSAKIYYSSPILAGNKFYIAREDGVVITATVSDKGLKDVKENDLGEGVIASLVMVNDKLLIRGEQHLFCIGK